MHITDPIADMLTRIRNANNAKHDTVDVPASNMKKSSLRSCWMRAISRTSSSSTTVLRALSALP